MNYSRDVETMSDADPRRLLLERLIRDGDTGATPQLPAATARSEPASYAQRRLWFVDQLQQLDAPYTLHAVQRLPFAVDASLLERSINEIVMRHEVLRTTFTLREGEVLQDITAKLHIPLGLVDLQSLPETRRESEALRQMSLTIGRRFDLERGPLLRPELYRLAEQSSLFMIAVHHIVFDWQSFQVFFKELDAIYRAGAAGRPHALTNSQAQYVSLAREQRARLTPQRIKEEVKFWETELAGLSMLNLPIDRPRPRVPTFQGGQRQLQLPVALVQRLQQCAIQAQATLFGVLLSGLWAALGRLCGQDDFAIGLPVTGRDTEPRQDAIGLYVDTLVTRARWSGDPTATELIAAARAALGRCLAHRALPFEMLVQYLQPVRDLGVNPLFQVGFQLMQHPLPQGDSNGADPGRSSAMFDLCIDLWPQEQEIRGRIQYSADLFDSPTVDLLIRAFEEALLWLIEGNKRLSELSFDSGLQASQLSMINGETGALQGRSCLDLIAEAAHRHPDLPALEGSSQVLTYRELINRVDSLASAIESRDLPPGSIAIIELERSPDLICLQLALMRCRIAFSCLDPAWPIERRRGIVSEARSPLVIDAREWRGLRNANDAAPDLQPPDRSDSAYVIFTSGSTGRPKGVVIEHCGLLNVALAQRKIFGLGAGRRVAQLSSPTFDASVFETVLALCSGATLVVAPPGILVGDELERFLDASGIDSIVIPPSILTTMQTEACTSLRLICVAGESCPADLAERFSAGRAFWNLYGPTETTIWATYGRTPVGAKISIGRPIPNLRAMVIDSLSRIVPFGMVGELCVGGVGLARGYLNLDSLTRERFVQGIAGFPERFYRTGDLVRMTRAGELVFVGRVDRQVKVRGLRIEPEEVELVLRTDPEVDDVVVGTVPVGGEPALVAYLQSGTLNEALLIDRCRGLVRERLPSYMSPSHYVVLKVFARSDSGKVDLKALPAPTSVSSSTQSYVELTTAAEQQVATLMQQVLQVPRVGASHDFFGIGGHSLAAAQLVSRLRAFFKVELTIGDVFAHSMVSELAAHIESLTEERPEQVDEVQLVRLPRTARFEQPEGKTR